MKKHLILFDFDETYYKHNTMPEDIKDLRKMENTLNNLALSKRAIIAILTGSSITSVLNKMNSINMEFKPNHIFSDLSTRMFTFRQGHYEESKKFKKIVFSTPFRKKEVLEIITTMSSKHNCELKPQRTFRNQETLYNFYYFTKGNVNLDLKILNEMKDYAKTKNYTMKFNKCNPLAGDPNGAYDVDFIPKNGGKLFATKFLINLYNISTENIIGFGDSGNDYEFLSFIKNSFVMCNSCDEMMRSEFNVSKYPYYKGINYHINNYLEDFYYD